MKAFPNNSYNSFKHFIWCIKIQTIREFLNIFSAKKAKKNLFLAKNEMTSDNHNKFKILLKQWITTTESVVVIPKKLNIKIQIYFLSSSHCYQNSFFLIMRPKYASSGQVIELNNTSFRRRVTIPRKHLKHFYTLLFRLQIWILYHRIYTYLHDL